MGNVYVGTYEFDPGPGLRQHDGNPTPNHFVIRDDEFDQYMAILRRLQGQGHLAVEERYGELWVYRHSDRTQRFYFTSDRVEFSVFVQVLLRG